MFKWKQRNELKERRKKINENSNQRHQTNGLNGYTAAAATAGATTTTTTKAPKKKNEMK